MHWSEALSFFALFSSSSPCSGFQTPNFLLLNFLASVNRVLTSRLLFVLLIARFALCTMRGSRSYCSFNVVINSASGIRTRVSSSTSARPRVSADAKSTPKGWPVWTTGNMLSDAFPMAGIIRHMVEVPNAFQSSGFFIAPGVFMARKYEGVKASIPFACKAVTHCRLKSTRLELFSAGLCPGVAEAVADKCSCTGASASSPS